MNKKIFLVLLAAACVHVPVTNRKQMKLLPETMLQNMAATEYKAVIAKGPISQNAAEIEKIRRVGNRISSAIRNYLMKHKQGKRLDGIVWEFNLIEQQVVNAWCMPGGKVAFYTGIMPLCNTDEFIATVMGHEIAHAIARHGNERMSQQLLLTTGQVAVSVAVANKPKETQDLFLQAYGVGTALGLILPYSRLHEYEADKMGLVFMAMAGYDPRKSVDFWKKMAAIGGQKPPQFMSTHPSDENRIAELNKFMPTALSHFQGK